MINTIRYNSSNLGFFAAGEIAARVAGRTWEAAVADTLVHPLGMTRTAPAAVDQSGNVAASHVEIAGKPQAVSWNELRVLAAAVPLPRRRPTWCAGCGCCSTRAGSVSARSCSRRRCRRCSSRAWSPRRPLRRCRRSAIGPASASPWGGGVFHFNGYPVIEKGGALAGIRSVIELVPDLRLGVAVLANLNLTAFPEAVRAFVLEQYLGPAQSDLQAEIKVTSAKVQALLKPAAPPPHPGPPSLPLAGYAVPSASPIYGTFTVIQAGDTLQIEAGPARYPGTLSHVSRDTFGLSWGDSAIGSDVVTFTVGPDRQASRFETEGLGAFTPGDATVPGEPVPLEID